MCVYPVNSFNAVDAFCSASCGLFTFSVSVFKRDVAYCRRETTGDRLELKPCMFFKDSVVQGIELLGLGVTSALNGVELDSGRFGECFGTEPSMSCCHRRCINPVVLSWPFRDTSDAVVSRFGLNMSFLADVAMPYQQEKTRGAGAEV